MKKTTLLAALMLATASAQAQNYTLNGVEYQTKITAVVVDNFDGQTLTTPPAGKSKTITITKRSSFNYAR